MVILSSITVKKNPTEKGTDIQIEHCLTVSHSSNSVESHFKAKMSERDIQERLTKKLQEHIGKYYPPRCNYLLVQVDPLLKLCREKYEGDLEKFEKDRIKPTAALLENILANKLPITYEDKDQVYVLIHLTEPDIGMETGEVVIWVGKNDPSSLSMRYTRYVTERDGVLLPNPHYESTKMKIKKEDMYRCMTTSYYSELRKDFKEKGAERYSLVMRLFVAYNITTKSMISLDYDKVLVNRRRRLRPNPKLRVRAESGVQESGEDPVAKSTEQQELSQALAPYRDYRATKQGSVSTDQDYRSSSPTGTEASAYNPPEGPDRLTDESTDEEDAVVDETELGGNDNKIEQKSGEPELEATVKLVPRRAPRDGYLDQNEAVGPNTDPRGRPVDPSVATKGPVDDYV